MSELSPWASRRGVIAGVSALVLAGCRREPEKKAPAKQTPAGPPEGSLEWAVAGAWRSPSDRARDAWRHPKETLEFFGLAPGQTVVEFWPGAGWWTEILAPYLARTKGTLYAANFQVGAGAEPAQVEIVDRFRKRFGSDKKLYGDVKMTEFGPTSGPVVPAGTADLVMFMRNLHNWMAAGIAEKAFADAFAALKPGGVLGIEQHRADIGGTQDPAATSGYVQEPYVKQLAAEAGFAFVASSEVNANPKDTKDHPFGVWTLPPQRLTAPRGQPANPAFDRSKYDAIGESDRMTLKFRKPA
ncbi:class I SAM-dependent methyltransferase [Caulobacter sp. 17J65-9]|uniref:class I SAM-dependent methyltransferase n=1 Tax=Caulobacter sp. 17J65-9 TaxID=2709382 RepID=UPI0013CC7FD2|nr:class I SAM-dependent methyltransferase [Caulobacter sp. 17J65-9]NEX93741.1 class I SAM-dependent methyltransferase [Caulobacter sp. 17J65-9]